MRLAVAASGAALLLAACAGGPAPGATPRSEPVSQTEREEALSTPTELLFWTWVPDIQNQVDLFMAEYPAIDVELVNVGQGSPHYQKLRTALRSGRGVPDVAQVEFQYLSSFTLGEHLMDLAPYGAAELEDDYADWIWDQVSEGDAVYGIPQDVGPMGNLYREDLLAQAGVTPPATWEEFAAAARTYRAAMPDSYLTNLPGNDAGQLVGLLWQSGARPFGYDGEETVTIDLDTPQVQRVVELWDTLIREDLVAVDPDFTDQWYQGLSNGRYASWQAAAWGPVYLQGTAGTTSGLWRAAPIPQWAPGENVSSNWGGSTDAVLTTTQNPVAAAELARWINTEEEPAVRLATEQFLFPAYDPVLTHPDFVGQEAEFYGGQRVNQVFAEITGTVSSDFGWLPFTDYVYASYNETVGAAIADRDPLAPAVEAWAADLVAYAQEQGFTVE
ncbi:ABC transporter substrate-binding protein [Cellulomonas shaoxiangyii]|uniref:ABC transporter substrate-binding protein n=1 Tax=Cellulomonas shaoxiangyii TaxID=2566013 RepID=UPI001FB83570|nr:extracellular solute-binding protein [Cellulomonas shaoxiangyii]